MASKLKEIIVEIHRRSLWQVVGIFLVGGWIAFEVVQTLTEGLGLPDWIPALALVLLIVFFPIVLATAFVQEGLGDRAEPVAEEAPPGEWEIPDSGLDAPTTESGPEDGDPSMEPPREDGGTRHKLLTWRNAILAGLAGVLIFGGSGVGYLGLRYAGVGPFGTLMATGDWEGRERIVLADFANRTGDSLIAYGATEWFRVALTGSEVVGLVGGDYLAGVLERMGLDPEVTLDCDRAREVAIRDGLKAAVCGEVVEVGSRFQVSSELILAETGMSLWADQERAHERDEVIDAVERLSRRLRERVGESLRTIHAAEALPDVTTASLEALRKFHLGRTAQARGDYIEAKLFFREALALDSTFAYAYRALGVGVYGNRGQTDSTRIMLTRAFEFRQHATNAERFRIEGDYHTYVTGDEEAAIRALERSVEAGDSTTLLNLGIKISSVMRDLDRAEEVLSLAVEKNDSSAIHLNALASVLAGQGRYDRAIQIYRLATEKSGSGFSFEGWVRVEAARGNYTEAEALLEAAREEHAADPGWQASNSMNLAYLAMVQGRLSEAEGYLEDALASHLGRSQMSAAIHDVWEQAAIAVRLRGDTLRALELVERTLVLWPMDSPLAADLAYGTLARTLALAGQAERARAYFESWERTITVEARDVQRIRHLC
ncbi:tetratricopeptide repeat protein, partial [Gemmatimonadota bacterium]